MKLMPWRLNIVRAFMMFIIVRASSDHGFWKIRKNGFGMRQELSALAGRLAEELYEAGWLWWLLVRH